MNVQTMITYITSAGIMIGATDLLLGERMHLGCRFRAAFEMAGSMFLSMTGVMCIAPVIASLLRKPVTGICGWAGIDPSILGIILGTDMGGYRIAMSLAESETAALMHGLITAACFGGTITFALPLSIAVIQKEKYDDFARGVVIGMIMIPVSSSTFGLALGLPVKALVYNNIPILLLSCAFAFGFLRHPEGMQHFVARFADVISKVGVLSIAMGGISYLTGWELPGGFTPVMENMIVICGIVIVLSGMLPVMELFCRGLRIPLERIGIRFGLDAVSVSGVLFTMVSCAPTLSLINRMNRRGRILNGMWATLCAAVFGSQMSYVLNVRPDALAPFILAKVIGGVSGLLVTMIYISRRIPAGE